MKLTNLDLSFYQTAIYFYLKNTEFKYLSPEQKQSYKKIMDECRIKLKKYPGSIAICNIFDKNIK